MQTVCMLCMRIQSSDPFVNVLQTDFLLEEKVKIIKKTQSPKIFIVRFGP